jgi:hypothetical protein
LASITVTRLHVLVGEKGLRHRAGIGETGRLDQDAVELVLALHQSFDDADQVATHGAADAAVVHLEHFLVGVHHEVVVDAELTEFVHDHGVFLAVLLAENPVEQSGLAGAEIAGEHGDGHLGRGRGTGHAKSSNLALEIGARAPQVQSVPGPLSRGCTERFWSGISRLL